MGSFFEEQRKRQAELVEARRKKQSGEIADAETQAPAVLTFSEKWENFWYYYKWHTIIAVFLAVTLIIATAQCAEREKFDSEFVLFSYNTFTAAEMDAIEAGIEKHYPDLNGDGEVNVQLIDCSYSDKELSDQQSAKKQKLTAVLASHNDALVFIVDDESFKFLEESHKGFFVNIGLSQKEGRAEPLPESFYKAVNETLPEGFSLPKGLYLTRRIADETTLIGQSDGIEEKVAAADKAIKDIAG